MKWHRSPPVSLSGPRDNFKLHTFHVNPALFKKYVAAFRHGGQEVVVRGTGKATGECRGVEDATERMVLATQRHNREAPANVGAGCGISIRELMERIAGTVNLHGRIAEDATKPAGRPRGMLDTSRAEGYFRFKARVPFGEGLRETF